MGQKMTLYWDAKQQKERISTTRQNIMLKMILYQSPYRIATLAC
jgi:hypothetical protein